MQLRSPTQKLWQDHSCQQINRFIMMKVANRYLKICPFWEGWVRAATGSALNLFHFFQNQALGAKADAPLFLFQTLRLSLYDSSRHPRGSRRNYSILNPVGGAGAVMGGPESYSYAPISHAPSTPLVHHLDQYYILTQECTPCSWDNLMQ